MYDLSDVNNPNKLLYDGLVISQQKVSTSGCLLRIVCVPKKYPQTFLKQSILFSVFSKRAPCDAQSAV
jgi:hypothetical protein